MDSDEFPLIDIGHEDDTLIRNLPPDDAGHFACSPLVVAGSVGYSRPPKTILKGKAQFGEIDGTLPDNNKENHNESGNMKPGSSNLSMDPQKMKRNKKAGGYNLRKSLAWDKAFFTEEGVLSSSELSMICGTPIKLDGKYLPAIYEEQKTPTHANPTLTNLQTIESKSFRKLQFSRTKDKRTVEGSILKQKSLASGSSLKGKKLASAASAKNSERKEGSSLKNRTPTSTNKRLLSTSPAKPLSHISKIPRVPLFKPDAHPTASSTTTSHVKRNRITPSVPSAQKQLGQKGCSNTRSTSSGAKIVSQRIPKPSKSSDQRTRKSLTVPCSPAQSLTGNKVSNIKVVTSEDNSGKMLPVRLEPNHGSCKASVSVHANTGNTSSIGQSIQHQVAKPSGLRMPSPSLRFFSEPKVSNPVSIGQGNVELGETCNAIQSKIPKATMSRIPSPGPAQPCSVSPILHNAGSTFGDIQSITPLCRVQPPPLSYINIPKIHDEILHAKKDDLIVRVQDLLDEKPLEQVNNKCLEEVGKYLMEHEHSILSSEGADGKDNKPVSPIGECRNNDENLLHSSEDNAKEGQNRFPAIHSPAGSNCCLETPYRADGYNEVQELQCPSHVTNNISQVQDGLSSSIKDLLRKSSSPERTFETDAIASIMPEIEVYEPLLVRETLSASLENIVDTTNKQQELEDNAFRNVTNEDKVNEPFPLEVALSASLETEPQVEENLDLSVAEYIDETDLTGQNTDLEFQKSPRAKTSQVDAVVCDVELPLSQTQGLGSMDAKSTKLETDRHHIISDEPLIPNETTPASLKSKEADLVICHPTELIDDNNIEMLVNANQNDNQSANATATNDSAGCSPHSSVDLSFPLTASKECNNGVDEVETDYWMNQEPPNPYLKDQEAENHTVLIYDSASENDNMSDQAIIQEPQWSSRISGDCNLTSAANCDILVSSSPCKYESTNVRDETMDETDEQVESANHHEDIHNIDSEDEKTSSRILKNGKILSQLIIRPPENVAPFSDEWLAAVEAAGEDILTLKTGPVQNSPPSRISPEPSPWSPVKRKNNQGIGPYDCTKHNTGQH